MCELVQSKYLSSSEFVTVLKAQSMKYGLPWKGEEERVVLEMFTGQSVTEAKFVECFGTGKS